MAEYMEYAKERGRWWASKYPLYADDIIATTLLLLVKALDARIPEKNIKGYLSACIDNGMRDFLQNNYLIKIPRYEIGKRRAANKSLDDLPRALLMDDHELWDLRITREHPTWKHMHVEDILNLLGLTEEECELIRLRIEERSLSEIGETLGKTKVRIHQILAKIRERYLELASNPKKQILRPHVQD